MSLRVRHCVECPGCQTWYLIGFSPYANGAYLVCAGNGAEEEYTLYCFCGTDVRHRWRWREVKACEITRAVHERGYGSPEEVQPVSVSCRGGKRSNVPELRSVLLLRGR